MKEKREKKGNKGKKSLVDLKNFRSTRLKELTFGAKSLGASSTSIQTTSSASLDLPRTFYFTNDTINICNIVGKYDKKTTPIFDQDYLTYNRDKLILLFDGGDKNVWYYFNNNGYSTFEKTILGDVQGYLFIYFNSTSTDSCNKCYSYLFGSNLCETYDSNQGDIFAVVIKNIAQINALNKNENVKSSGRFLSNVLLSPSANNNETIQKVIDDLKRYDNYTTPIIPHDPANPLILDYEYINLSCLPNTLFYINDEIIPRYYSFKVNQNTFLPESEAKKLTFDDIKLIGGWNGFLTVEAKLNYNDGTPTIQFKQTGSSTITFRNLYFEDTENISGNPNGPRFYGPKYFTLRINATVNPAP